MEKESLVTKYIDYFKCRNVTETKSVARAFMWSVGYCNGNIIEVKCKPNTLKKWNLYRLVYSYSKSGSHCIIHSYECVNEVPKEVKDCGKERHYVDTIYSFVHMTPNKLSSKKYDVVFSVKNGDESFVIHTHWNGKKKSEVAKEVREEYLCLNKGYPWNIQINNVNSPIPEEMARIIKEGFEKGTYKEWDAIVF